MKKLKQQKGITLVALVITIIILLILAGVSIMLLGKNGIIAKAKWSAYVTEYETIKEQEELYKDSYLIEKMGGKDKGEALSEISTEKNEIEMYPVSSKFNIGDAQNSLKESIKQIESINDNDLENENSVNLYKVDLNKINVKAKKSYVINIVSGMLYSIEHEEYQGKLYHTPRMGIEKNSEKLDEKIDKVGIYEMTVDAGQTVNWDSIQIYYDKYIENSLSIKVYTSDDEVNWTEETIEKGSQLNNEEKYNLSNLNRTQYLKIKVEVKGISGKNSEVDYILVNFYKYREIEVKPQIEITGVEKTGTTYTVPTEANGETQAEGTGNVVQKITIPTEEGDYILDLGENYGSPSSQIKITNADGTEENYTITNNLELKKKQIKPGATVEIKTTLKAGEGIGQVKLLEKEKQLSTKTIETMKNSTTENKWVTVEKHKYAYNNGGIGYWEKCSVNDIEVDKTGIIQNAEETEKRIKISYQVSTDGITWSKEFTNIQEAENKKYLKVQVEYQTLNGTEYGNTSNNKIKVTLNDGSWKVTFKDEDGTELLTKRVYFENSNKQGTIIIPNIENTKGEKEFVCWKIDLNEYIPGSNYTVTQDIIFTAYYSKNKKKGRYILFEVYDHIDGNSSSISEIKVYDKNETPISYNIIVNEAFDSQTNGAPWYWTEGRYWNYTNLYDGNIKYESNSEGGQNCTGFLSESDPNSNYFARFIIDLGEITDIGDIGDIKMCIGDVESRTPRSVSAYVINNYTSDTYANNVAQRNNEGLTLIKTIDFSSVVFEPTWYSFINEFQTKRVLFEIYDHIGSNSCSVSEIQIYDKKGTLIPYNVMVNKVFDSQTNGAPWYWTEGRFWNYTNLYDGNVSNTNNSEGGENCTIFLYESNPNMNSFSRFIVDLGEASDIEDIKICIGDKSDRTPKSVSAYMINNYSSDTYANNVVQRNNDGLTLIKTINFSSIVSEPTWYSFMK